MSPAYKQREITVKGIIVGAQTELRRTPDAIRAILQRQLVPAVQKQTGYLAQVARLNAPIGPTLAPADRVYKREWGEGAHIGDPRPVKHKGGTLRAGIKPTPVTMSGFEVAGGVEAVADHAARQHFELETSFPGSKNLLRKGYTSKLQPGTPEGGVGGMFLTRSFVFNGRRVLERIAASMRQGGG